MKRFLAAVTFSLVAVLAGCATTQPAKPMPRGTPSNALAPQPSGSLAALEAQIAQRAGSDKSGFMLLDSNDDGLRWRLAMIDSAQHSLDIQYYVWWGDESGNILMSRVIDAARRGVRVRILIDDLSTALKDASHPQLRDTVISAIDAHPNIEIRLFNPWQERPLFSRLFEMFQQMDRLNYRMHNKQLVADNRALIIGGRNIGNEYFGLSSEFNFRDLDVLAVGPVARQASVVFDTFWNSDMVVPVSALEKAETPVDLEAELATMRKELAAASSLSRFPVPPQNWDPSLAKLPAAMHTGTSRIYSDVPDSTKVKHNMPAMVRELLGTGKQEVLITNAYIIPGSSAMARMAEAIKGGTKYRMLTNSLASHDVPAVNSHYRQWRRPLLEAGVDLYEIRADAAIQPILADTAPTKAEFMGLHVKAMVVDRQRVFIGSMNLDPRSWSLNSEMGVVVESPGLAEELARNMERDMQPENAWHVVLAPNGSIRWVSGDTTLTAQPARSVWQRVQDVIFVVLPKEYY
jgi:putative cardiolipin synthase